MSKVLFLCNIELANPKRGTPIHVARLLRELRREHDLIVCAASVPEDLSDVFVRYPQEKGLSKLCAMLRIADTYKPRTIFTIGQVGLLAPVILKYLCGVRIVVELQGVEYIEHYAAGHIGLFRYYFWKYKVWMLLFLYDSVIVMSKCGAIEYPGSGGWKIMYPAVDIDNVPQIEEYTSLPPLIVGYMGNTRGYQGLDYLIEAVVLARNRHLDVRMHLVLSGDSTEICSKIKSEGLTDVTKVLRNLQQHEAHREMLKTSVLVIPRPNVLEAVYGFPSKLPESLATGLPVIMTNVGPVAELMPELGKHSIVIPTDDIPHRLADALQCVANMSTLERKQRGDAARVYARKFSWETTARIVSDEL